MAAFRYGEREPASYLGFPLEITQSAVTVTCPDGRPLGQPRTLSGARRLIKAYRNDKQGPPPLTLGASATGPNRKGV